MMIKGIFLLSLFFTFAWASPLLDDHIVKREAGPQPMPQAPHIPMPPRPAREAYGPGGYGGYDHSYGRFEYGQPDFGFPGDNFIGFDKYDRGSPSPYGYGYDKPEIVERVEKIERPGFVYERPSVEILEEARFRPGYNNNHFGGHGFGGGPEIVEKIEKIERPSQPYGFDRSQGYDRFGFAAEFGPRFGPEFGQRFGPEFGQRFGPEFGQRFGPGQRCNCNRFGNDFFDSGSLFDSPRFEGLHDYRKENSFPGWCSPYNNHNNYGY